MLILAPGEKRVLYTSASAEVGTLAISAPTFDFQSYNRTPIASNVAATGQDAAGQTVRAWYTFDCNNPPGGGAALVKGQMYWINWRLPVTSTLDGIDRVESPSQLLIINE